MQRKDKTVNIPKVICMSINIVFIYFDNNFYKHARGQ